MLETRWIIRSIVARTQQRLAKKNRVTPRVTRPSSLSDVHRDASSLPPTKHATIPAIMPPTKYDPSSEAEQPVALPSAPQIVLASGIILQPPLSRRGHGPGLIAFLPDFEWTSGHHHVEHTPPRTCLDPEPIQKWAEEGFAVVGIRGKQYLNMQDLFQLAITALIDFDSVDIKDKFGIIVYDSDILPTILEAVARQQHITCLVSYGAACNAASSVPSLSHIPNKASALTTDRNQNHSCHVYPTGGRFFVLPQHEEYHAGLAGVSHSRSLVFLKKHIGGPYFDIEAVWDEHSYFEFEVRSLAKTMGTMVAEPYVNHIPTMTGGIGRDNLTAFYREHFIFSNPPDTAMEPVSRTVGADRIIDEFIFSLTHDRFVDWLLPGVAPTGKKLSIPMISNVSVRGDRLCHEHIWWDQGGVLKQAGILPSHLPHPCTRESTRLPVAGIEAVRLLVDETDGQSNEMLQESWSSQ